MVDIWPIIDQLIGNGCPLCRRPGDGICTGCDPQLPHNHHPCPRCALPLPRTAPADSLCADCQADPPSFDRTLAPLLYRPPVDDLIARFKYHHRLDLGRLLAQRLADAVDAGRARPQLLLPVPMARRNLAARGFNQAAELAARLSRLLQVPWSADGLDRRHGNRHQRGLDRQARLRNIRNCFAVRGTLPPHVAIVDDVVTTGATVEELAKTLRAAGVAEIEVWAVARTPRERATQGM